MSKKDVTKREIGAAKGTSAVESVVERAVESAVAPAPIEAREQTAVSASASEVPDGKATSKKTPATSRSGENKKPPATDKEPSAIGESSTPEKNGENVDLRAPAAAKDIGAKGGKRNDSANKNNKKPSKADKAAIKAEKRRREEEKKVALKKLEALKRQIKRGELSLSERNIREPENSFYGEKLPYPGGFPVYCCKYVIVLDGVNKIAMRFFNASDILVTGLRLTLTEKDKNGEIIEVKKLERTGLFAERGTKFAVADAEVSRECACAEIRVDTVISDMYRYVMDEKGEVTLRYGAADPTSDLYFKNRPTHTVKKRKRGYVIISVLAVLCFAAVSLAVAMKLGIADKATYDDAQGEEDAITYQISGGDLYVEA